MRLYRFVPIQLPLSFMVIAVNTRFLLKESMEGYGYFIREVFSRITRQQPQHQFYFLFDRPYDLGFIFSGNVTPLVIAPPARHPLLWKYWYDVKVPLVLRKIKADVFVSPDGFASLATKVPQCLVIHDLGFLHYPDMYKRNQAAFYKRYTPKYVKKATAIATVSQFSKNDLLQHYPVKPEKITVVYSAAKEIFAPVDMDTKTAVKEKYTDNKEYFVYAGAIHPRKNIINLLKAFSIFKKWQRSSMKLVLAGRLAWKNDEFLQLLQTYKYKNDVVLTGYIEEKALVELIGAAYALVYPSLFEGFGVPVLEAMKCQVPVLTSAGSSMAEIAEEAALYFDPQSPTDMADKLMQVYKDETLRNVLIQKGKPLAHKYTWQRTADLLWQCMMQATGRSEG